MTQERVTIDQLERAEAAVRTEQHYGFEFAECRGCANVTAVDVQGMCVQCASDLEGMALYDEMSGERVLGWIVISVGTLLISGGGWGFGAIMRWW